LGQTAQCSRPDHVRPSAEAPTLAQLEANPELFDSLPPQVRADLHEQAEVLAARLRARQFARVQPQVWNQAPQEPDPLLTPAEAAQLVGGGMTKDQLMRYARAHRPRWARKLSRKRVGFDKAGLLKWRDGR
jgi:hypothetical protein